MSDTEFVSLPSGELHGRRLGDNGSIMLWRTTDGKREAIVGRSFACVDPDCPCTHVSLQGVAINEAAIEGRVKLEVKSFPDGVEGGRPFSVSIDTATGEVSEDEGGTDQNILDWLRREVDGELLDYLDRARLRAKGIDIDVMAEPGEVEPWSAGEMQCYGSFYPHCREDLYLLDSREYLLLDHYCPEPDCDCGDVILAFSKADEVAPGRDVGAALLTLSKRTRAVDENAVEFEVHEAGSQELLRRLYRLFRKRYPDVSFLRDRQARMKSGSAPYRQPAQSVVSTKVGRNEPCPCGSGKKYKKCCL